MNIAYHYGPNLTHFTPSLTSWQQQRTWQDSKWCYDS